MPDPATINEVVDEQHKQESTERSNMCAGTCAPQLFSFPDSLCPRLTCATMFLLAEINACLACLRGEASGSQHDPIGMSSPTPTRMHARTHACTHTTRVSSLPSSSSSALPSPPPSILLLLLLLRPHPPPPSASVFVCEYVWPPLSLGCLDPGARSARRPELRLIFFLTGLFVFFLTVGLFGCIGGMCVIVLVHVCVCVCVHARACVCALSGASGWSEGTQSTKSSGLRAGLEPRDASLRSRASILSLAVLVRSCSSPLRPSSINI